MFKEFKEFALKGNVVDMAVGIIIGGAFGTIVTSLVNDVLMPPIGLMIGGVDSTSLFFVLKAGVPPPPYVSLDEAKAAGAVTLNIGLFVNALIAFVILAFALFMVIKAMNSLRRRAEAAPAAAAPAPPSKEEQLLGEIRDLLRARV